MEGIFNPISILLHIINAAILFTALYFLLYKPVRKFLKARSEKIQSDMDKAVEAQAEAQKNLEASKEALRNAEKNSSEALADIISQARNEARSILDKAQADAAQIMEDARNEADEYIARNNEAMRSEAASLALAIASKVLSREIDAQVHKELIDDFLKKVE